MKFFIDDNWVYYTQDEDLYKTSVDSYGFFNTNNGIPVNLCAESSDSQRTDHLERLRQLLMPKHELAQDLTQLTLF